MYTHVAEGVMNRRKQPPALKVMAYQRISKMVHDLGVAWTRRLYSAAVAGRKSWLQEMASVKAEVVLVRQTLSSLPLSDVTLLVTRYLVKDMTKTIASYDKHNGRPVITRIFDRHVHHKICANILKSVLFPCIRVCNLQQVGSEFVQKLLIKLLYFFPYIDILVLPETMNLKCIRPLLRSIELMNNLQEFYFYVGCTRAIIIQLSQFCPQLKIFCVQNSKHVGDKCVKHLLKFRQLRVLNVGGTSVSSHGYTTLLSALPQVQNIGWIDQVDPILSHIPAGLPSVTTFLGNISDAGLLVQKCPNINDLTLFEIAVDVSGLRELECVSRLTIIGGSCAAIRFTDVITRLGATLTVLELTRVPDIRIRDVIHSCPVLKSLHFSYCNITRSAVYDRDLPHFQNLKTLTFKKNGGTFHVRSVLELYVNLSVFHAEDMAVRFEEVIRAVVRAGGFQHLTTLYLHRCRTISIQTLWFLVRNCPKLVNISSSCSVTDNDLATLAQFVKRNNISLVLCS
jgi:hypothetical protein